MLGEVSEGVSGRGRVTCLGVIGGAGEAIWTASVTGLLPEISRRDIDDGGCCIFEKRMN